MLSEIESEIQLNLKPKIHIPIFKMTLTHRDSNYKQKQS